MKTSAYTPFDVSTRDRVVGFFVIGAVLLFLLGFLIPFVQRFADDEGLPFHTILDQTYGIAPDAMVSLRGVSIGNVTQVAITKEGLVRVEFKLSPVYKSFYTLKSSLTVDTNIGVSTILTGSGLILSPGNANNGLLEPGQFIPTSAPQGISSILEELDMVQLTDQITEIITSVELITSGFAENQGTIYTSLDNLEQVTAKLSLVSTEFPAMVKSIEASLAALQSSLEGVDQLVLHADKDLQLSLKNTVKLTEQATQTLAEAEILFQTAEPALSHLPNVLLTTDVALQSITELTNQLSHSWLFGGSNDNESAGQPDMTISSPHPHDNNIYTTEPESP